MEPPISHENNSTELGKYAQGKASEAFSGAHETFEIPLIQMDSVDMGPLVLCLFD